MSADDGPDQPSQRSSLPGRKWLRQVVEVLGLVVGLVLFSRLHNLAGTDPGLAMANARSLQAVESSLHLNIEVAANHWLAEHAMLVQAAVLSYRLYYLPLFGVLVWVFIRHAEVYRTVRRVLMVMAPSALLTFWLVPMAPPRFATRGIVDIVAEHELFAAAAAASRDLTNGQNHFSAMPSLHVGWSALCAYAAWLALRSQHQRLALLVWLFPMIMVLVVITTGNHYVLDVFGSAVLLGISIMVAWAADRCLRAGRVRSQRPAMTKRAATTVVPPDQDQRRPSRDGFR